MTRSCTIRLPLTAGICRWCRCTDAEGCDVGCYWMDRPHTLCSACAPLERAMTTIAGRRALADLAQAYGHEHWPPRRAEKRKVRRTSHP